MGQYKLAFYFCWQIGLCVEYEHGEKISLYLPFLQVYYGLRREAYGVKFFKFY